jgi:ABC-type phosphate transport system auxiliary subunit
MAELKALFDARYLPQLMAAIERHEEAETWGSWMAVMVAAQAVRGDEAAQRILREEPGWQLTPQGSFV